MKKNLLISIFALAAVLASCTKVDVDMPTPSSSPARSEQQVEKKAEQKSESIELSQKSISFSPVSYTQQTKAAGDVEGLTSFKAFAYYTGHSGWSDMIIDNMVKYIDGDAVTNHNGTWCTNKDYYWPKTGKISFACYAPAVDGLLDRSNSAASLFHKTNYHNDGTTDLLIADFVEDATESSTQGGVDVLFHHVLSMVKFNIKAKSTAANGLHFEIKLKSVSLSSVYQNANFNWNSSTNTSTWSSLGNAQNMSLFNSEDEGSDVVSLSSSYNTSVLGGNIIMLPQSLDNINLTVKFDLVTKNEAGVELDSNEDMEETVALKQTKIASWAMSTKYEYNIIINPLSGDLITFDPAIVEWTTSTNTVSM